MKLLKIFAEPFAATTQRIPETTQIELVVFLIAEIVFPLTVFRPLTPDKTIPSNAFAVPPGLLKLLTLFDKIFMPATLTTFIP